MNEDLRDLNPEGDKPVEPGSWTDMWNKYGTPILGHAAVAAKKVSEVSKTSAFAPVKSIGYAVDLFMNHLPEFLEEGKNWQEVQEANAKQVLIKNQNLSRTERFELLGDVLAGRYSADTCVRTESMQNLSNTDTNKTPLEAYQEGLPLRTGLDIDWQAIKNDPEGLVLGLQDIFDFRNNPLSETGFRIQAYAQKYMHLDARNWVTRNILRIGESHNSNERSMSDGSMVQGVNGSIQWNPSEYGMIRMMYGDEFFKWAAAINPKNIYRKLATPGNVSNIISNLPEDNPNPKWNDFSLATGIAAVGLIFNDPLVLNDWALDDITRITFGRWGATRKLVEVPSKVSKTDEIVEYLEARAAATNFAEGADKFPDFASWSWNRQIEDLRGRGVHAAENSSEVQQLRRQYTEALNNGATNEQLIEISQQITSKIKEVQDAISPTTMPYYDLYESMHHLATTYSQEAHFLAYLTENDYLNPTIAIHNFLQLKDPTSRLPISHAYVNALKSGIGAEQIFNQAETWLTGVISKVKNMSPSQRLGYIHNLQQQSAQLRRGRDNYLKLLSEVQGLNMPPVRQRQLIRRVFADMAAGLERRKAGNQIMNLPGEELLGGVDDISKLDVTSLSDIAPKRIGQDPVTREYLSTNEPSLAVDQMTENDLGLFADDWMDPYFLSPLHRQTGLAYEAAKRKQLDWAKTTYEHPQFKRILDLSRKRGIHRFKERIQRDALGKMFVLGRNGNYETFIDFIIPNNPEAVQQLTKSGRGTLQEAVNTQLQNHNHKSTLLWSEHDMIRQQAQDTLDELFDRSDNLPPAMQVEYDYLTQTIDDLQITSHPASDTPVSVQDQIQQHVNALNNLKSNHIHKSGMRWDPTHKGTFNRLEQLQQQRDQLYTQYLEHANNPPDVNQMINKMLIDGYTLDYDQLWQRVTGRNPTVQELDLMIEVNNLSDYLWKELLTVSPELVERAGPDRDFMSLIRLLQGSQESSVTRGLDPHNIFNPNRAVSDQFTSYDIGDAVSFAVESVNRHIHNKPVLERVRLLKERAIDMENSNATSHWTAMERRLQGLNPSWEEGVDSWWFNHIIKNIKNPHIRATMMRHNIAAPTKIALGVVRGMYVGTLFGNTSYMVKNLAGMGNTAAIFGRTPTLRAALKLCIDPDEIFRKAGLAMDLEDFYGISGMRGTLGRGAFKANSITENILRGTAWYAAQDLRLHQWAREGLIEAPTMHAAEKAGLHLQMMNEGLDAAFETQHIYSIMGRPVWGSNMDLLHSKLLRPAQQYVNYNAKQATFGIRRLMQGEFGPFMRWLAITGEQIRIAHSLGIDATGFATAAFGQEQILTARGVNPEGFMSPHTKALWDILVGMNAAVNGDMPEAERRWQSWARTATSTVLGSRGVPVTAISRWMRAGMEADEDGLVRDSRGAPSYYMSDQELTLRQLGLPTDANRRRETLRMMKQQDALKHQATLQLIRTNVQWMLRERPDENADPEARKAWSASLSAEIREVIEQSGETITSEELNNIIISEQIPKWLREPINEQHLDLLDDWALINAPALEQLKNQAAASQLLTTVLNKKHATVLAELNLRTVGDLQKYIVPTDITNQVLDNLSEYYGLNRNVFKMINGHPYVRNPETNAYERIDPVTFADVLVSLTKGMNQ